MFLRIKKSTSFLIFEKKKMNIPILLGHFGVWESKISYKSYESNVIIVSESINFLKLIAAIAMELDLDEVRKKLK